MSVERVRRFGTFEGVFLPTILSIFGVILFLRTGWAVGNAGLLNALLILIVSEFISLTTALSLSAVSTNIEVGTGGVYYIVSRSLGIDAGGAIGIPLYFSQAISVSFYILGFLESVQILRGVTFDFRLYGTLVLLLFAFIAYKGADFAVRFQYLIFAFLLFGILSFLLAPGWAPRSVNLTPHYIRGYNFWKVFAVFFPAVTGITAGIGLSGELRDPGRSIPRGSLLAVAVSTLVYALVMFKSASVAPFDLLRGNVGIFIESARIPFLVVLGVWAATVSSALTFIIGAPRTLKALADDGIAPSFLASTMGSKRDEPRAGVIVTFLIAEAFILLGSLNSVAVVITMFFLVTYGVSNYSATIQALIRNPSFRPRFRVHWLFSLAGFIGTLFAMFLISFYASIIALVLISLIYLLLKRRGLHQTWGDVRAGIWMSLARFSLLRLEEEEIDPINWRPNLMVFTGNPETRLHLARMAGWLSRGNGIITFFNVIEHSCDTPHPAREKELARIREFIRNNNLDAFAEVELVRDIWEAIPCIAQAHGIGQLYSNVALFGWGDSSEGEVNLLKAVRRLVWLNRDVLILRYDVERGFGEKEKIDVWWGGKGGNIQLMLLLTYILKLNDEWKSAEPRILKVLSPGEDRKRVHAEIREKLYRARFEAKIEIIDPGEGLIKDLIGRYSSETDLVILGLPVPPEGTEKAVASRIKNLLAPLGTVLLVRSVTQKEFFLQEG